MAISLSELAGTVTLTFTNDGSFNGTILQLLANGDFDVLAASNPDVAALTTATATDVEIFGDDDDGQLVVNWQAGFPDLNYDGGLGAETLDFNFAVNAGSGQLTVNNGSIEFGAFGSPSEVLINHSNVETVNIDTGSTPVLAVLAGSDPVSITSSPVGDVFLVSVGAGHNISAGTGNDSLSLTRSDNVTVRADVSSANSGNIEVTGGSNIVDFDSVEFVGINLTGGNFDAIVDMTNSANLPELRIIGASAANNDLILDNVNGSITANIFTDSSINETILHGGNALSLFNLNNDLIVNGDGSNNTLIVDFVSPSSGVAINTIDDIFYNGGGQTGAPGDTLEITNATVNFINFNFINENDGSIELNKAGPHTIHYTGLEPIVATSGIVATNITLNYLGAAETVTVSTGTAAGTLDADSTSGEMTSFSLPTGSLTVDMSGGAGADVINIQGLDPAFDADLTVIGSNAVTPVDTLNLNTLTNDLGAGNLLATTGFVDIRVGSNLFTSGAGSIELEAARQIELEIGGTIRTGTGDISLSGNALSSTSGNFTGVTLANNTEVTSVTGNIEIVGGGGDTGSSNHGVDISLASVETVNGDITITGTGNSASVNNSGVFIRDGASIISVNGDINIVTPDTPDILSGHSDFELAGLGSQIMTTGGTINFDIGDNATFGNGTTVAADTVSILLDQGVSDVGTGSTFVVGSNAVFDAALGVSITGGDDDDTFSVRPQEDGELTIEGGSQVTADTLELNLTGTTGISWTITGVGSGQFEFDAPHETVFYSGIEMIDFAVGGPVDVVIDMSLLAGGEDGLANALTVQLVSGNPSDLEILYDSDTTDALPPEVLLTVSVSDIASLSVLGGSDDDVISMDSTISSMPIFSGGAGVDSLELFNADLDLTVLAAEIQDTGTNGSVFSATYSDFESLTISDGASSNTLTLDYNTTDGLDATSGLDIAFNSAVDLAPISDAIEFINGDFLNLEFNYDNENDGNVVVDGSQTITYTGLEPLAATSMITAADVVLNYSGAAETVTVAAGTIAGTLDVDSTLGESSSFVAPTNSLTIDMSVGAGADTINVQGLDPVFDADLTIIGSDAVTPVDALNFNVSATDVGTGNVLATMGFENIAVLSSLATSGSGSIELAAAKQVQLANNVSSGDGNITITSSGDGVGATNLGFLATSNADVTSVNGDINITTTDSGLDYSQFQLLDAGTTLATTGGNITLNIGDDALFDNGTEVNATGGAIDINLDQGAADVGVGATLTALDTGIFNSASGTSINGGDDDDSIIIAPQLDSELTVDGGSQVTADMLQLDLTGVTGAMLNITGVNVGNLTFDPPHNSVFYSNIEEIDFVGGSPVGLVIDLSLLSGGEDGLANELTVQLNSSDPSKIEVLYDANTTDGSPADVLLTLDVADIASVSVLGGTDDDAINIQTDVVDLVSVDGGAGTDALSLLNANIDLTVLGAEINDTPTGGSLFSNTYVNFESLEINDGASSDTVTLDYNAVDGLDSSSGLPISFNSAVDAAPISDRIKFSNGDFLSLEFNYDNENDGNVVVDGLQTITYTGLEPLEAISMVTATDVTLNYNGGAETITLQAITVPGTFDVDSTLGERTLFAIPTDNLTLDTSAGTGADTINIDSFDPSFDGNLTIIGSDASAPVDILNLNATMMNLGSGNLLADSGLQNINVNGTVLTLGAGSIDLAASQQILIDSLGSLQTADGDITLKANETGSVTGNFSGINLESNAVIAVTGNGGIDLTGVGGTNFGNSGIWLEFGSSISSLGTGAMASAITLEGTSGVGASNNRGVYLDSNSSINSIDGDVMITGVSQGLGNGNTGVDLFNSAISSTGTGTFAANITINGTGSASGIDSSSRGINVASSDSEISTVDGDITLIGQGGSGTSSEHQGVRIFLGDVLSTGEGDISITGVGGNGTVDNDGVNITNLGTGGLIASSATGADAGTITIDGTGGSGTNENSGVSIVGANSGNETVVSAVDGDISITGLGSSSAGDFNMGVKIERGAIIESTGVGVDAANIVINGTGGNAVNSNYGVFLGSDSAFTDSPIIRSEEGDISITGIGGGSGTDNIGIYLEESASILSVNGDITLTTPDSADDHSTLLLDDNGTQINTTNGNIMLDVGDDAFFGNGTAVSAAAGAITILLDQGASDVGVGSTLTALDANIFNSGGGTMITSGDDNDSFNLSAQVGSVVTLDGGAQVTADLLALDIAGTTGGTLTITGFNAGNFTFDSPHNAVFYSNIEELDITAGGPVDLVIDLNAIAGGADGLANEVVLQLQSGDPSKLEILFDPDTTDATPASALPVLSVIDLTDIANVSVLGGTDDDVLTLNHANGALQSVSALAEINYDGGAGVDALAFDGGTFSSFVVNHASANSGDVVIDGVQTVNYSALEPIDVIATPIVDVELNHTTAAETIDVSFVAGDLFVDSTAAENVHFLPELIDNAFTLHAGDIGDDVVNINIDFLAFGPSINTMTFNGGTGFDTAFLSHELKLDGLPPTTPVSSVLPTALPTTPNVVFENFEAIYMPDFSISKHVAGFDDLDASGDLTAGDVVNYHIKVSNVGFVKFDEITIEDSVNGSLEATFTVMDLNPGETEVIEYDYTVTGAEGASILNEISATSVQVLDPRTDSVEFDVAGTQVGVPDDIALVGTPDNDALFAEPDLIAAGLNGDDLIIDGSGSNPHLFGNEGDDRFEVGVPDALLDNFLGGAGDDTFHVCADDGTQMADLSADVISGGPGFDVLSLHGVNTVIMSDITLGSLLERIESEFLDTELWGTSDRNTFDLRNTELDNITAVRAGDGADNIIGPDVASGQVELDGGAGADTIKAGAIGGDVLVGGADNDLLFGHNGSQDIFKFGDDHDQDLVFAFNNGEDLIDLSSITYSIDPVADFAAWKAAHVVAGNSVKIKTNDAATNDDVVTLLGVNDVDETDFIF